MVLLTGDTNYYLIKRPTEDLEISENAFGGSNYYNDFYDMKINANSANKWKTYKQKSQFSKLLVYPDYNPSESNRIVGSPYLNQEGTIVLRENISEGSSTGAEGIVTEIDSVASLVKIATDVSYVDSILDVESTSDYPTLPSSINVPVTFLNSQLGKFYSETYSGETVYGTAVDGVYDWTFEISGSIGDFDTYEETMLGVKYFDISNGVFPSSIIDSTDSTPEQNRIGIYFDGLAGSKEVVIDIQKQCGITFNGANYGLSNVKLYILGLNKSFVNLINQNGTGVFYGTISLQMTDVNISKDDMIEIHNFKLPSPIITAVGVNFTNKQKANRTNDGFYTINDGDEIWKKQVSLNGTTTNLIDSTSSKNLKLYSSSQPNSDLSGNSTLLTDDDGNVSALLLTLKVPGFKLFKSAGMKYFLESKQYVTLSSTEMVDDYNQSFGIVDNDGEYCLKEYYDENARIGSQVVSGTITNAYNYVETTSFNINLAVGVVKYKYTPPDDDKFQLEVITKAKGGKFIKSLYYINKPIDKWYNMAFYKRVLQSKDGTQIKSNIHFLLNDVDAQTSGQISSKPGEIFKCYVTDDATVDGTSIKFNIGASRPLSNWMETLFPSQGNNYLSLMKNYASLYDIKFDMCQRTAWDCKFTNDPKYLAYSDDDLTDQFSNKTRANFDLFRISDALNDVTFVNTKGEIKLFANAELESILSKGISNSISNGIKNNINFGSENSVSVPFYNLYVSGGFTDTTDPENGYGLYTDVKINDVLNSDLLANSEYANKIRTILTTTYPRRVLYKDSIDNYILKNRPNDIICPIIKGVGLEVSNLMFVSTPNLYYGKSGAAYAESYFESQGAVKDYEEFFGNPQHRLPPVSYKHRLLDSDYATFIYGNCQKFESIQNYNNIDTVVESIQYDYNEVPSRISYVWGNSQVTRSETISDEEREGSSKLYWNKSAFNEYVSEVGSVYNYIDSQHVTNTTIIEVGSVIDRQCVLLPVVNVPLEYEARSSESGIVKVTDNIIATAALGYNVQGYPKNVMLSYNTNGNVTINSTLKNYIYLEQSDKSNDCVLGSTIQKPVFTDVIQQNIESLGEKLIFLPNPTITMITNNGITDVGTSIIAGGTITETLRNSASVDDAKVFYNGYSIGLSGNEINSLFRNAVFINEVLMDDVPVYYYPNENSVIYLDEIDKKYVKFFMNPFAINSSPQSNSDYISIVDFNGMNVFYDESKLNILSGQLSGQSVSTSMTTLKCFNYDGQLINFDLDSITSDEVLATSVYSESEVGYNYKNLIQTYRQNSNNIKENALLSSLPIDMDCAPIFGVIWANLSSVIEDERYINDMEYDISYYAGNRTALLDQYYGANISAVKFKINEEDLKSAPTYIEIKLLKYDPIESHFYWDHNGSMDLDITDTYEAKYDYDNPGDRFIEKTFINTGNNISNHVYGIKFKIKSIVPQNQTINSCKIANVQIFGSNILNKYGTPRAVEDIYIRRADANYADAYPVKCSEYIWRLPNTGAEWDAVLSELENDESLENRNSYRTVSQYISRLADRHSDNTIYNNDAQSYISAVGGTNFSRINSYFICNKTNQNNQISEVLSDNYLVDSDIKISWKYVDYVYIYYSCYSFNAKELLDMYFGDKIYTAVREKLNNNINNLNLNSAFKDKYKFGGGIAVQKEYSLNTQTKSQVFEWKADVRTDQLDTYQDHYVTDHTKTTYYAQDVSQQTTTKTTDIYKTGHGYGNNKYVGTTTTVTTKTKYSEPYVSATKTQHDVHYVGTTKLATSITRNYLGLTLQNSKYSSVDNWTKTFSPRQIKYKIN